MIDMIDDPLGGSRNGWYVVSIMITERPGRKESVGNTAYSVRVLHSAGCAQELGTYIHK